MEVSDAVRTYAEEKFGKVIKFYDRISSIEVTFDDGNRGSRHLRVLAHIEHAQPMVAESTSPDLMACVDEAAGELERQLKRYKETHRDTKKHVGDTIRGLGASETGAKADSQPG